MGVLGTELKDGIPDRLRYLLFLSLARHLFAEKIGKQKKVPLFRDFNENSVF